MTFSPEGRVSMMLSPSSQLIVPVGKSHIVVPGEESSSRGRLPNNDLIPDEAGVLGERKAGNLLDPEGL
jgi:hypothetical protein